MDVQALDVADPEHAAYWDALHTLILWKIGEATRREGDERGGGDAVHASVDSDVDAIFTGQSYVELLELEVEVERELASGSCSDPEFWQAVQSRCVSNSV